MFLESSSPELSQILSTVNSKILLPKLLTKEQTELVRKQKNRAKLEAEPVEVTLGDVTLTLEHIDLNKLPNRFKTYKKIIEKSSSQEDYENIVRVLEGFQTAGIKIDTTWKPMAIMTLADAGMHSTLLKALQRPAATGLSMREWMVLAAVLRAIHEKAANADWSKEETTKALRFAMQVAELLEHEDHCGAQDRGKMKAHNDWTGEPAVIAVPTELAAVLASRHGGDIGEVKKLATRLTSALKQKNYQVGLPLTFLLSYVPVKLTCMIVFSRDHFRTIFSHHR